MYFNFNKLKLLLCIYININVIIYFNNFIFLENNNPLLTSAVTQTTPHEAVTLQPPKHYVLGNFTNRPSTPLSNITNGKKFISYIVYSLIQCPLQ